MTVAAIFAADTHLSEQTWASRSAVRGDSFFGFEQVCQLAIKYGVPLCLAGDCWELMHDPNPSPQTVGFVRRQIDILQQAGCPFYFVNGQHDRLASPYWFNAIHSHASHVGGKEFMLGGKLWYGIDYFESYQGSQVYADVPKKLDGVMAHQRWSEFAGSKHFASETLDSLSWVPSVVSGDMHKLIVTDTGSQWQVSPGATHMRSQSEPDLHYAILYEPDKPEPFVPHKLRSRPVYRFEVVEQTAWIDQIGEVALHIDSVRDEFIKDGGDPDVARPLVVVTDRVSCGAGDILQRATETPHIISRLVRESQGEGLINDGSWASDSLEQGVDELSARIGRDRGMSKGALYLLESLVRDDDLYLEAMRYVGKEDA